MAAFNENNCDALKLEKEHVIDVYDKIASSFSETRYKPWPKVKQFIDSLPNGSVVFDIGCGNGKYLNLNDNVLSIGCDTSLQLLCICRQKNMETVAANILSLPFRTNSSDVCICIAVIHHLSTESRRVDAIKEIVRVLKVGGICLIYVWAFEQQKDGKNSKYIKVGKASDERSSVTDSVLPVHCNRTTFKEQELFVPFKCKGESHSLLRYYHLFKEGELRSLLNQIDSIAVKDEYYDNGNWCVIIQKFK